MKKRFYTGLIVFAVLLLALGRLIVRPPRVLKELFAPPGRPSPLQRVPGRASPLS